MTRITQKLQNFIEEKWLSRLTPLLESKKESERMFNELTKKNETGKLIYPPQKDIFNEYSLG